MNDVSHGWAVAEASVRGSSHQRAGTPNQDAVASVEVPGRVPGLVAAVADGHGGARYVRSDCGARIAVATACAVAREAVLDLGSCHDELVIRDRLSGPLIEKLVARWRSQVSTHWRRNPFNAEEICRAGAALEPDPYLAYGSTIIIGLFTSEWVGVVQVGDGDVIVVGAGAVLSPVSEDARLVGGQTTSLCLPTAARDGRVAVLTAPRLPELVLLATDGYGNSFASPAWRNEIAVDLVESVHRQGLAGVAAQLPAWLTESAVAGGDDVSMVLAHRST